MLKYRNKPGEDNYRWEPLSMQMRRQQMTVATRMEHTMTRRGNTMMKTISSPPVKPMTTSEELEKWKGLRKLFEDDDVLMKYNKSLTTRNIYIGKNYLDDKPEISPYLRKVKNGSEGARFYTKEGVKSCHPHLPLLYCMIKRSDYDLEKVKGKKKVLNERNISFVYFKRHAEACTKISFGATECKRIKVIVQEPLADVRPGRRTAQIVNILFPNEVDPTEILTPSELEEQKRIRSYCEAYGLYKMEKGAAVHVIQNLFEHRSKWIQACHFQSTIQLEQLQNILTPNCWVEKMENFRPILATTTFDKTSTTRRLVNLMTGVLAFNKSGSPIETLRKWVIQRSTPSFIDMVANCDPDPNVEIIRKIMNMPVRRVLRYGDYTIYPQMVGEAKWNGVTHVYLGMERHHVISGRDRDVRGTVFFNRPDFHKLERMELTLDSRCFKKDNSQQIVQFVNFCLFYFLLIPQALERFEDQNSSNPGYTNYKISQELMEICWDTVRRAKLGITKKGQRFNNNCVSFVTVRSLDQFTPILLDDDCYIGYNLDMIDSRGVTVMSFKASEIPSVEQDLPLYSDIGGNVWWLISMYMNQCAYCFMVNELRDPTMLSLAERLKAQITPECEGKDVGAWARKECDIIRGLTRTFTFQSEEGLYHFNRFMRILPLTFREGTDVEFDDFVPRFYKLVDTRIDIDNDKRFAFYCKKATKELFNKWNKVKMYDQCTLNNFMARKGFVPTEKKYKNVYCGFPPDFKKLTGFGIKMLNLTTYYVRVRKTKFSKPLIIHRFKRKIHEDEGVKKRQKVFHSADVD